MTLYLYEYTAVNEGSTYNTWYVPHSMWYFTVCYATESYTTVRCVLWWALGPASFLTSFLSTGGLFMDLSVRQVAVVCLVWLLLLSRHHWACTTTSYERFLGNQPVSHSLAMLQHVRKTWLPSFTFFTQNAITAFLIGWSAQTLNNLKPSAFSRSKHSFLSLLTAHCHPFPLFMSPVPCTPQNCQVSLFLS